LKHSPANDKEPHHITSVCREDVGILAADVISRCFHCRRNSSPGSVQGQLDEELKDALNVLWIGFLKVGQCEGETNVAQTVYYFAIGLRSRSARDEYEGKVLMFTKVMKLSSSGCLRPFALGVGCMILMRI